MSGAVPASIPFCRRASLGKASGVKTDGALWFLQRRIGGGCALRHHLLSASSFISKLFEHKCAPSARERGCGALNRRLGCGASQREPD
jgi:hypothetical protein